MQSKLLVYPIYISIKKRQLKTCLQNTFSKFEAIKREKVKNLSFHFFFTFSFFSLFFFQKEISKKRKSKKGQSKKKEKEKI